MAPPHTHYRRQAPPATATRNNLGPLTTAFVAPPYCTRAALACPTCASAALGQSCRANGPSATPAEDTGCWPRATAYPADAAAPLKGLGFYSPGVLCPTGFTSACTSISTTQGQKTSAPKVTGQFQFPPVAGETAVGCCPVGYGCAIQDGVQKCHQVATSTAFDGMVCNGGPEGQVSSFGVPFTVGAVTVASMDLWAPMVQIIHMSTDLPKANVLDTAETSSASPTPTPTPSATSKVSNSLPEATSMTSATPPSTPAASETAVAPGPPLVPANRGITKGAEIGIILGPLLSAALIVGALYFLIRRKRQFRPVRNFSGAKFVSPGPSQTSSMGSDHKGAATVYKVAEYKPEMPTANDPDSPYNIARNVEGTPAQDGSGMGAVVVTPRGYAAGRSEGIADFDMSTVDPQMPGPPVPAMLGHFRGASLGDEHRGLESPIDGTSPFRLKRGNTMKRVDVHGPRADGEVLLSNGSKLVRAISPNPSHQSSQAELEWDLPLQRQESFSRPRPAATATPRPLTGASSIYWDDGRSSVYSWNNAVATIPQEPMPETRIDLEKSKSFSRPRPKKDENEVNANMPRVTREDAGL